MRKLALLLFMWYGVHGAMAQVQHLDVQVSDTNDHPVSGMKLTTKGAASTETTDPAGKARLAYSSSTGVLDLLILEPKNIIIISPWQASVQVPPTFWLLTVATKGQRELLTKKRAVAHLAARANFLQGRKEIGEPTPTVLSRNQAVARTAEAVGLKGEELNAQIDALLKDSADPYDEGQLALLNHQYERASELFSSALKQVDPQKDSTSLERATDSAFFLGQSLFESVRYREAAVAYQKAGELRPNDPIILNNEGLSWSKAGEYGKAEQLFQQSLELMKDRNQADSVDFTTTQNNVAALAVYRGDLAAAAAIFTDVLRQREKLLPATDFRIATSYNNVAALLIAARECQRARTLLTEALRIYQANSIAPSEAEALRMYRENNFPRSGGARESPQSITVGGGQQGTIVVGSELMGNTPGTASTLINLSAAEVCLNKLDRAEQMLSLALQIEQGQPTPNSADLASTYLARGKVIQAKHNLSSSATDFATALSLFEKVYGDAHPLTATAMIALADVWLAQGKSKEAKPLYEKALTIRVQQFGSESPQAKEVETKLVRLELLIND